ncbi:MAG: hypothetical protein ABIW76_20545 [Fibrobacteria bacterium]
MAEMNPEALYAQDFIDESGMTSLEPDGLGHFPHDGVSGLDFIKGPTGSAWGTRHDEVRFERAPQRGAIPAEGDGAGGPE